jgi:hypothetical protein
MLFVILLYISLHRLNLAKKFVLAVGIIWLLLSVLPWTIVITLSGFHCTFATLISLNMASVWFNKELI